MKIAGHAFTFGDNVDTDQIYPGRFLELTEKEEIARHAMAGADPGFASRLEEGDMIVAGRNFGCGSSREHAVITLQAAGLGAVVAASFARIFYRNALNLGLPVLRCGALQTVVEDGDRIALDLNEGLLTVEGKESFELEDDYPFVARVAARGGIRNIFAEDGRFR